jgi:serine protease Do
VPRLSFIHLSGPRRGQTDSFDGLPVALGSASDADLRVPGVDARHAVVVERGSEIVLRDLGSSGGTFLAGQEVQEAVLRDGDMLELGRGGPAVRYRHHGARHPSLIRALNWARPDGAPARISDGAALVRALLRETTARTRRPFRWALAAAVVLGTALLGWSFTESYRLRGEVGRLQADLLRVEAERRQFEARIADERLRSEANRQSLEQRIDEDRAREASLRQKLADAASGQVAELQADLAATRQRLEALEGEREAGELIIRQYGGGVGLVQASYAFYDAESRPLRYRVDAEGRPLHEDDGSLALDPDAKGEIHTIDYYGTGFVVDEAGLVLTNRHVAEPWWGSEAAGQLVRRGYRPRFVLCRVFFPKQAEPYELDIYAVSEKWDLALMRIDLEGRAVPPVLPLDAGGRGAVAGQPVVVVGYPTGIEAILAKADSAVVSEIIAEHGTSRQQLVESLSRRGLITPSTTQGHIGDVTSTDIVFDAATTEGGSGGPVFNRNRRVIAVEYAVLSRFGGNSFGVPISYAVDLMRSARRGRKSG